MTLVLPTWFKGRQGKGEPAGDNLYKLSGPNLVEGYIGIRGSDGAWQAFVVRTPDGEDVDASHTPLTSTYEAWEAAFELFRRHFVV
jgi:hypothetical protein